MAYDPNYNPKGRSNLTPAGNGLSDWLRSQYPNGEYDHDYAGFDPFRTKEGRDFTYGLAGGLDSVTGGVDKILYGDQNAPGLIGGTRQVNPDAYSNISGDPYRGLAVGMDGRPLMGGQGDATRNQQQDLIQMLQAQAQGTGPSLAQGMLRQATDRNIAAGASMAASGRGPGAAASAYNANNMAATANQQAAGDASQLRLQEQLQAQAMLGGQLSNVRGQDIAQQNLMFQEQAQRDQLVQEYMKMGYSADQANREAALKMEQLKNDAYKAGNGGGSFLGGMFSAMSDETVKTDVKDASKDLYSFLDKLDAHDYKYKNEKHGKGRRVSVMAQELEKSDLGKKFVFETNDGKAVDYGKGFGTMLAATASLHKRLKQIETRHG